MVVVNITINAIPARRKELLQTLHELIGVMGSEQGFLEARVDIDAGNQNVVTLVEGWETQGDVEAYMHSEYFDVLVGATEILSTSSKIACSQHDGVFQEACDSAYAVHMKGEIEL